MATSSATVAGACSASSAASATCCRGTTRTWTGACGSTSRKATAWSVRATTSAGTSPATIRQNRQSSPTRHIVSRIVIGHARKPRGYGARATTVIGHAEVRLMPEMTSGWSADEALEVLYVAHWRQLVRLAVMLLRDQGAAE